MAPLLLMSDENTASMSHWPLCGGPITFPMQITLYYLRISSKCQCSICLEGDKSTLQKVEVPKSKLYYSERRIIIRKEGNLLHYTETSVHKIVYVQLQCATKTNTSNSAEKYLYIK